MSTKKKTGRNSKVRGKTAARSRRSGGPVTGRRAADHAKALGEVLERFAAPGGKRGKITLHEAIDEFRRACIRVALDANAKANSKTNMHATAQTLGIARSYLYTLIDELDIRA